MSYGSSGKPATMPGFTEYCIARGAEAEKLAVEAFETTERRVAPKRAIPPLIDRLGGKYGVMRGESLPPVHRSIHPESSAVTIIVYWSSSIEWHRPILYTDLQ